MTGKIIPRTADEWALYARGFEAGFAAASRTVDRWADAERASGIETRSAKTAGLGPKDESPTRKGTSKSTKDSTHDH